MQASFCPSFPCFLAVYQLYYYKPLDTEMSCNYWEKALIQKPSFQTPIKNKLAISGYSAKCFGHQLVRCWRASFPYYMFKEVWNSWALVLGQHNTLARDYCPRLWVGNVLLSTHDKLGQKITNFLITCERFHWAKSEILRWLPWEKYFSPSFCSLGHAWLKLHSLPYLPIKVIRAGRHVVILTYCFL